MGVAASLGCGLTIFDWKPTKARSSCPRCSERAASGEATFQKETDYAIPKGLKLHDEYGRAFRIATATWQSFAPQTSRADLDAATVTRSFAVDFLRQCLGYTDLALCPAPLAANGDQRVVKCYLPIRLLQLTTRRRRPATVGIRSFDHLLQLKPRGHFHSIDIGGNLTTPAAD